MTQYTLSQYLEKTLHVCIITIVPRPLVSIIRPLLPGPVKAVLFRGLACPCGVCMFCLCLCGLSLSTCVSHAAVCLGCDSWDRLQTPTSGWRRGRNRVDGLTHYYYYYFTQGAQSIFCPTITQHNLRCHHNEKPSLVTVCKSISSFTFIDLKCELSYEEWHECIPGRWVCIQPAPLRASLRVCTHRCFFRPAGNAWTLPTCCLLRSSVTL